MQIICSLTDRKVLARYQYVLSLTLRVQNALKEATGRRSTSATGENSKPMSLSAGLSSSHTTASRYRSQQVSFRSSLTCWLHRCFNLASLFRLLRLATLSSCHNLQISTSFVLFYLIGSNKTNPASTRRGGAGGAAAGEEARG